MVNGSTHIVWQYFPRSHACPDPLRSVVDVFQNVAVRIASSSHEGQTSNEALKKVRPGLEKLGFRVERGKTQSDKIPVPVLFGPNGTVAKSFEVDAYHPAEGIVLEVEAGRAYSNNQFLKDLFQACVMTDVEHLIIAVRQDYRGAGDYDNVVKFIDTLYSSQRFNLPLRGVLIIGY